MTFLIFPQRKEITILTTPFVNNGSEEIDYIGELIQIGIYSSFKNAPDYKILHPMEYNDKISVFSGIDNSDDFCKYLEIGERVYSDCVIYGNYYKEDEDIIDLYVFVRKSKKFFDIK